MTDGLAAICNCTFWLGESLALQEQFRLIMCTCICTQLQKAGYMLVLKALRRLSESDRDI